MGQKKEIYPTYDGRRGQPRTDLKGGGEYCWEYSQCLYIFFVVEFLRLMKTTTVLNSLFCIKLMAVGNSKVYDCPFLFCRIIILTVLLCILYNTFLFHTQFHNAFLGGGNLAMLKKQLQKFE